MLISELFKYIGYGILISGSFYFFVISLFVYLNGREINEYYLILFGKLNKKDIYILIVSIIIFTIYYTMAKYDNAITNIHKHKFIIEHIGDYTK